MIKFRHFELILVSHDQSAQLYLIQNERILRVLLFGTPIAIGKAAMHEREARFETNDLGLLVFVTVAVWVMVIYSGWF